MSSFTAERMQIKQEGRIDAPVDRVFPLACPYEEYKWIDGWDCDVIYPASGKIEDGCIFTEVRSVPLLHDAEGGATTWYAALYEPDDFRVHFLLLTDISIIKYKIEMEAAGEGETRIELDMVITARNERGNAFIAGDGRKKASAMLMGLGHMLKHYCETGEMLKLEHQAPVH
jgi:hypothetical protein